MYNNVYWSGLQKIWTIKGNKVLASLMGKISGEEFWNIKPLELKNSFPEISQEMSNNFLSERIKLNISNEYLRLNKHNVKIIGLYDSSYPRRLKNIFDPPPLLYVKGTLVESNLVIALVGARKASPYGLKTAAKFSQDLSRNKIQIVSGLARGIDATGHQGALEGGGGTVAVLGCGVDIVYPRENLKLYSQIVNSVNSAVISEFPMGTEPVKFYFPMRNRIISGLADGILVIEAREKSGSLITAELGMEQGKDVFAVPGPIDSSLYKGSHKLIKDGAKLTDCLEDILEEYGQLVLFKESPLKEKLLGAIEMDILALLSSDPLGIEDIIIKTNYTTQEVITALSILEIKGYTKQVIGRKYISLNWGD